MDPISEKIKNFESMYDQKIMPGVPIVIRLDARGFSRITKKLQKPYDPFILDIFNSTMLDSIIDIDSAVFGYQYNDEINFILNSDQPWFHNKIQKLASVVASKVTINFMKNTLCHEVPPAFDGDVEFDATVFALPNVQEVINYLIFKQNDARRNAVLQTSTFELTKLYGREEALKMLQGKKSKEKIDLLYSECDIDFYKYYPPSFINGVGSYKVPYIIKNDTAEPNIKNRWVLDIDLANFRSDPEFLYNIIDSGADIFREDRDFEE